MADAAVVAGAADAAGVEAAKDADGAEELVAAALAD
jgi:hypothetical protein